MNFLPFCFGLLMGASDPWTDASTQDLLGYARAVSLDITGNVPTAEDLANIEQAGTLPEEMLQSWLSSSEFETQVVERHREIFWNNLEITLMQRRRLGRRDDIYFNNNRARHLRLLGQAHCGLTEAVVDEYNRPLGWTINDDDGAIEEGYVWVNPYWDPDTPIKVCAFDAQLTPVSANGIDCSTEEAHEEQDCGCGPNLQWCMDNPTENLIEDALSADLNERVRSMLETNANYDALLTGNQMHLNGASIHFFRHLAQFDSDSYQRPVQLSELPDLEFSDKSWVVIDLDEHHDGVLTAPGWLLRHQTNRGRANRFYGGFLCETFIPTNNELSLEPTLNTPSPNLIVRDGCRDCHARLEPWAAYWGRWAEASMVYRSPVDFPSFMEECAQCSLISGVCSDFCEDYYLVEPSHTDETPYVGWFNPYAFLLDDKQEHPDLGPLGWTSDAIESGALTACMVENVSSWLLNWTESNASASDAWSEQLNTDLSYRNLVELIVTSPEYWRGEE